MISITCLLSLPHLIFASPTFSSLHQTPTLSATKLTPPAIPCREKTLEKMSPRSLITLFLACISVTAIAATTDPRTGPTFNLSKFLSFPDFRPMNNRRYHEMKLLGCATLQEDSGFIQIPAPQTNISFLAGRALYSSPIRLIDPATSTPASFRTTFSFQIDSAETNNPGGSGLTFIMVPDEVTVGRPGPWLAMLNDACEDDYKAFAVEFDTVRNEEFGDPNDHHVGINLGTILSHITIDASRSGISFKNGSAVRAWISYNGERRWMDLGLGLEDDPVPRQMIYSAQLDLSGFLQEYMFVGFSASTGHHTQIHSIKSWEFVSHSKAFLNVPSGTACEKKLFPWGRIHRRPPSAFLIFMAVVGLCSLILLNLYCNGKTTQKSRVAETVLVVKKQKPRPPKKPGRFFLTELSLATRCFSEGAIAGDGRRGTVFKGELKNGSDHVAIKRFWPQVVEKTGLERRKILREIGNLSRLRHPNVVPLRGWCSEKKELVLVYEYMPNGSLDKWLFTSGVVPWSRRLQVLRDVAEGLCFMHSGCGTKFLHKNVKISNILLDVSFRAAIGDFGVLGCQNAESLGESVQLLCPPEADYAQIPTEKMDVFGFGVVILETLSGRRSLDRRSFQSEEADIVQWAWSLRQNGQLIRLVDRRLGLNYDAEMALRLILVGLLCTLSDPCLRPSMEEVVSHMNEEKALPFLPFGSD